MPNQFQNLWNIEAQKQTGYEIWRQAKGKVDVFVAAAGTGGTVVGVSQALKPLNPNIKIVIVEPENSAVLSGEPPGHHKIQGVGEGFVPQNVMMRQIDEIMKISDKEAYETTRQLASKEGLLVGISSGANMAAAKRIAETMPEDKVVVTIFADNGERYLSVPGLFKKEGE